jgi:hypothetical protein
MDSENFRRSRSRRTKLLERHIARIPDRQVLPRRRTLGQDQNMYIDTRVGITGQSSTAPEQFVIGMSGNHEHRHLRRPDRCG